MSSRRFKGAVVSILLVSERFRSAVGVARPGGWDVPSRDWQTLGRADGKGTKQETAPAPEADPEDDLMQQLLKEMDEKKAAQAARAAESDVLSSSNTGLKGGNPKALFLQLTKLGIVAGLAYVGVKQILGLFHKLEKQRAAAQATPKGGSGMATTSAAAAEAPLTTLGDEDEAETAEIEAQEIRASTAADDAEGAEDAAAADEYAEAIAVENAEIAAAAAAWVPSATGGDEGAVTETLEPVVLAEEVVVEVGEGGEQDENEADDSEEEEEEAEALGVGETVAEAAADAAEEGGRRARDMSNV